MILQVLQHAGSGPVQIRAVFEDHVDEGIAEEGVATHHLGAGHRQHGGGDRVGDLLLDHARRLPGEAGTDDDLHVGQVGDGVHRGFDHHVGATECQDQAQQHDQKPVRHRPPDDRFNHGHGPRYRVLHP